MGKEKRRDLGGTVEEYGKRRFTKKSQKFIYTKTPSLLFPFLTDLLVCGLKNNADEEAQREGVTFVQDGHSHCSLYFCIFVFLD